MKGITKSAGRALLEALECERADEDECVRFIGSAHGGEFEIDHPCPDDRVFEYAGNPVLVVGPVTADDCTGRVLDFTGEHFRMVRGVLASSMEYDEACEAANA